MRNKIKCNVLSRAGGPETHDPLVDEVLRVTVVVTVHDPTGEGLLTGQVGNQWHRVVAEGRGHNHLSTFICGSLTLTIEILMLFSIANALMGELLIIAKIYD